MPKSKVVNFPPAAPSPTLPDDEAKEPSINALLDELEDESADTLPSTEAQRLLENTDLSLPHEFELEILADELLGVLGTYKRASYGRKSARNLGDTQRAQQMAQLERYSRLTAAMMMADYPGLKNIADEIATARAREAQRRRAQLLEDEGEE